MEIKKLENYKSNKELKDTIIEIFTKSPNKVIRPYNINIYSPKVSNQKYYTEKDQSKKNNLWTEWRKNQTIVDKNHKERIQKILDSLVEKKFLIEKENNYNSSEYYHKVKFFDIKFEKGIWTFEHPDKTKGIAKFDTIFNKYYINGKEKVSLRHFFIGYSVVPNHKYNQKNMKFDLQNDNTTPFGKFIVEKILPNPNKFTGHNYSNLGNFLPYFKKFENYYNWLQLGIKISHATEHPPSILTKQQRKWFVDKQITLTGTMLAVAHNHKNYFSNMLNLIDEEQIPNENSSWYLLLTNDNLQHLINNEGYDLKSTLRYIFNYIIPYEKMDLRYALGQLKDYASMHRQMEVNDFKRYPKFLKSNHDIIAGEFASYKKEYKLEIFEKQVNNDLSYEKIKTIKDDEGEEQEIVDFLVELPKNPDDLKFEGKELSHCVGSYIERIMDGSSQILFLRKIKGVPLVTLEIRGKVLIQARGLANRSITKEEKKYIKTYTNQMGLLMRV